MNEQMTMYLLSIRGTLAPSSLEEARVLHNSTAGAPESVAAARSLGDLSHMVHVPFGQNGNSTNEFLILDLWNRIEGLNQFFANPHVQEQAGRIFADRDPIVWIPAQGFTSYHIPATHGKSDRVVAVIRGNLKSQDDGMQLHNTIVNTLANKARMRGHLSHEAYLRLVPPGTDPSLEFFAVDVWMDGRGMGEHYQDTEVMNAFGGLFAEMPSASTWTRPAGEWIEW